MELSDSEGETNSTDEDARADDGDDGDDNDDVEGWGKEHPLYGLYTGGRGGIWSAAETDYIARYMLKNPSGIPTSCLATIYEDINARPIFHKCHVVDRLSLRAGWRKVLPDPHRFLL